MYTNSRYVLIDYINEELEGQEDKEDGIALHVSNNKEWAEEIKRFVRLIISEVTFKVVRCIWMFNLFLFLYRLIPR